MEKFASLVALLELREFLSAGHKMTTSFLTLHVKNTLHLKASLQSGVRGRRVNMKTEEGRVVKVMEFRSFGSLGHWKIHANKRFSWVWQRVKSAQSETFQFSLYILRSCKGAIFLLY